MKLDIAYRCQIGGRQENQDRVLTLEDAGLAAAALVVADGLGGHQGGALASRLAAEAIAQNFLLNPDLEEEHLRELFCLANDRVLENQQAAPGMRSTAAALFYHQGLLAGGYIGDTRIYRFSQGKLVYQSPDHSVPQMLVYAGEILPRQIRFHPRCGKRLPGKTAPRYAADLPCGSRSRCP